MTSLVLDSDFLSAFLKIGKLDRIRDYFQVKRLLLPTAVFREVASTSLTTALTALDWLEVQVVEPRALERATQVGGEDFIGLGEGEKEAISLALNQSESVLLSNDRQALRCAQGLGLNTVNVPAFLRAYRASGEEAAVEVGEMVTALEEKDHYRFSEEVRRSLLG